MTAPLIIRVSEREWPSSPSPAFGGRKHLDIAQAFAHLRRFPHDRLKIRATEIPRRKQHTIHIYAARRGLKVTTMTAGEWIYLKMYNPETDWRSGPHGHRKAAQGPAANAVATSASIATVKPAVNAVTAQEWRHAKRSLGI